MKFILLIVMSLISVSPCFAEDKQDISVNDLRSNDHVLGELNLPFGEFVTVEGVLKKINGKDFTKSDDIFYVEKINGKSVPEIITLDLKPLIGQKLVVGLRYELYGYEKMEKGTGIEGRATAGFQIESDPPFQNFFYVTEAKEIKSENSL
ncbi:MAG: hypothetical protein KBD53_07215 [Candidatus Omnitrophica bacterium]|nr:hypothetical protein [Candidatus Omnitrophota bacterium]